MAAKNHGPRFESLVAEAKKRVKEVSPQDVLQWINSGKDFCLIDTREESEWAVDHLPKAIHLGKGVIERDIETRIPKLDQLMVLYCGGGYRSALAVDNIQRMGYSNVLSLSGGVRGWRDLGFPFEKIEP